MLSLPHLGTAMTVGSLWAFFRAEFKGILLYLQVLIWIRVRYQQPKIFITFLHTACGKTVAELWERKKKKQTLVLPCLHYTAHRIVFCIGRRLE